MLTTRVTQVGALQKLSKDDLVGDSGAALQTYTKKYTSKGKDDKLRKPSHAIMK